MIHENTPFPHWENFRSLWSFSRYEELWSFLNQNSCLQVRGQRSLCLSEPVSISGVAGFKIPWENWQNRLRQKNTSIRGEKTHKTLRRGSYRRAGRHVRTSWTCRITTAMLWKLEEKSKKFWDILSNKLTEPWKTPPSSLINTIQHAGSSCQLCYFSWGYITWKF